MWLGSLTITQASSNCLAQPIDPVMELHHINIDMVGSDLKLFRASVEAALASGEICKRLTEPINLLFKNTRSSRRQQPRLKSNNIDKAYMPLLSWLLFSYGECGGSGHTETAVRRKHTFERKLKIPESMLWMAENIRDEHDSTLSLLQIIDRNMAFTKYGGPLIHVGVGADPHLWHKHQLSKNQQRKLADFATLRVLLATHFDRLHKGIDKRNAVTLAKMNQELKQAKEFDTNQINAGDEKEHLRQVRELEILADKIREDKVALQESVSMRNCQIAVLRYFKTQHDAYLAADGPVMSVDPEHVRFEVARFMGIARMAEADETHSVYEDLSQSSLSGQGSATGEEAEDEEQAYSEIETEADAYMALQLSKIHERKQQELGKSSGAHQATVEDAADVEDSPEFVDMGFISASCSDLEEQGLITEPLEAAFACAQCSQEASSSKVDATRDRSQAQACDSPFSIVYGPFDETSDGVLEVPPTESEHERGRSQTPHTTTNSKYAEI